MISRFSEETQEILKGFFIIFVAFSFVFGLISISLYWHMEIGLPLLVFAALSPIIGGFILDPITGFAAILFLLLIISFL